MVLGAKMVVEAVAYSKIVADAMTVTCRKRRAEQMKINAGMRCHDICPKMELEELFGQVKRRGRHSRSSWQCPNPFPTTTLPPATTARGFARHIRSLLEENGIHVAVLGCYTNPVNPIESQRQAEVPAHRALKICPRNRSGTW